MKSPSPLAPPPVGLALSSLVPPPELFTHASTLHGQAHVARVLVHAFRLIAVTGWIEEAPAVWAAVYLHDIARTHDGLCHRHGGDAMRKFETRPDLRALFAQGAVADSDYAAIFCPALHEPGVGMNRTCAEPWSYRTFHSCTPADQPRCIVTSKRSAGVSTGANLTRL